MASSFRVERQQFAQSVFDGDVCRPVVSGPDGGVESAVRIGEPLRTCVVEVGESTSFQLRRCGLIARDRA